MDELYRFLAKCFDHLKNQKVRFVGKSGGMNSQEPRTPQFSEWKSRVPRVALLMQGFTFLGFSYPGQPQFKSR